MTNQIGYDRWEELREEVRASSYRKRNPTHGLAVAET